MMLGRGIQHYRHISRYSEIVSVLVRYGFGDLLSRLNIYRYIDAGKRILRLKQVERLEAVSRSDRIRMVLEELGPTFIKLGQFASTRPDMLPIELVESLEKLQDAVPPFPQDQAKALVEKELGRPVGELFARFDERPFASASIGQVHRATLNDGQEVAVKVQRPNIAEQVSVDLEIMRNLALLIEKHVEGMRVFNLEQLVDEFAKALRKEMDFTAEARHIESFAANFRNDPGVYIPRVFHTFTTRRIIVTEFIEGIKITSVAELREAGLDPREIARRGAEVILKQIFVDGFFHADPHAGNILVKENNVICFLDLGMAGMLTPATRRRLSLIIVGIVRREPEQVVRVLYEFSDQPLARRENLEYDVAEILQEYASRTLGTINIGELLHRLSQLMQMYRFHLMPGFYLLVKALITLEGVGCRLDPAFNLMEHLEPFARRLVREEFGPRHAAREAVDTVQEFAALLRDLPYETRDILHLVKTGKVRIEFEHRGLEPMLGELYDLVNRVVYGLVLAALVIGSSIIVLSGIPPKLYGVPLIGLGGFVIAAAMGFWFLISIVRRKI